MLYHVKRLLLRGLGRVASRFFPSRLLPLFVVYDLPDLFHLVNQKNPTLLHIPTFFYGLTTQEIVRLMDREHFLPSRNKISWAEFLEDPQDLFRLHTVEYLPQVSCEDVFVFQEMLAYFRYVYDIDPKRKWLASFYEKEIKEGYFVPSYLKWLGDDIGFGLYASKNISEGDFIGSCSGVLRKKNRKMRKNPYCTQYAHSDLTIDSSQKGNLSRFINHSSTPNVEMIAVYIAPVFYMIYVAKSKIMKDTPLLMDYGTRYWKELGKSPKSL